MLFSPYFSIRFKGVFIAYLYIHIPQFFSTGFFEESNHTTALISKKIRSMGNVVKWHQYTNRRPSTDDLIRSYKQLGLEIRLVVNGSTTKGHVPSVVDYEQLPFPNSHVRTTSIQRDPSFIYNPKRSMKHTVVPKSLFTPFTPCSRALKSVLVRFFFHPK